ncbi:hypothetical protein GCM10009123_14400 [Kangiella japonica]|uniref:Intracellular proteinase inhibitor BsuPI domain-containing protein n=1 Tax=Kangiella japonica TaxID=647384 RepID=A0ABP3CK54_9GAMM
MKKILLVLASLLTIGISGCKDDDNKANLKATFSLKGYEIVNGQIELGEVKNTFVEQEPIAFDMVLTNDGIPTAHIEYASCGFDIIEIGDDSGDRVFSSEVTTTGCSGQWNIKIVYTGESIGTPTLWDQEIYQEDPNTGEIIATGDYLAPGQYTVQARAKYKLDSAEADWSEISFSNQSLTIEAAQ